MLTIHLCEISVLRREPPKDYDTEKAERKLSLYFRTTALEIISKDILMAAPDPKKKKKAQKKIEDMIETDARKRSVASFLLEWNEWREFYLKAGPIVLKTKGQLTLIEDAIEFCNVNKFKTNMMIACVHRAYVGYKHNPNFDAVVRRGEELYEKNYDLVEADIDRDEYQERALGR